MNRGVPLDPSFIGSSKKTTDEKRGNKKKCKGAHKKRPSMKKEPTKKCKGRIKKDIRWKRDNKKCQGAHQKRPLMKKEATPKTQRGLFKRPTIKKRQSRKTQRGLFQKTSDEKRDTPKNISGSKDIWEKKRHQKIQGANLHTKQRRLCFKRKWKNSYIPIFKIQGLTFPWEGECLVKRGFFKTRAFVHVRNSHFSKTKTKNAALTWLASSVIQQ